MSSLIDWEALCDAASMMFLWGLNKRRHCCRAYMSSLIDWEAQCDAASVMFLWGLTNIGIVVGPTCLA